MAVNGKVKAKKTAAELAAISKALRECTPKEYAQVIRTAGMVAYPYLALGQLIEDENPYFMPGQAVLTTADLAEIKRGGQFADRKAANKNLYHIDSDGGIPCPTDPGSKTWFFVSGVKPKDTPEKYGEHLPNSRQVVKTLEIAYGPNVDGGTGLKPPHIIILYCGGNSAA